MSNSLYARLGGAPSIEAAVGIFYKKVLDDSDLAPYFKGVKVRAQERQQIRFLTAALGGPNAYTGRDMLAAHAGLRITSNHFDQVAGHLVTTLQELGVPAELVDEVVGAVAPLKQYIVEVESPAPAPVVEAPVAQPVAAPVEELAAPVAQP